MATNGRFSPFADNDLVKHLSLDDLHSVQYLDKSSSKWITHFRNSPGISVAKGSILHLKDKDTEVIAVPDDTGKYEEKAQIKLEQTPTKRKPDWDQVIIDLTGPACEPMDKKCKLDTEGSNSPMRATSGVGLSVGFVPAKLSKFPARTVGEMDARLRWMVDNEWRYKNVETRFGMVFNCKYVQSSYYNHRNVWLTLKENGELKEKARDAEWLPLYSSVKATLGTSTVEIDVGRSVTKKTAASGELV